MIQPVFMLELNHKILSGVVTIGKYDGTHACLTAATTADKIIIHSPRKQNGIASGRIQWSEAHKEVAILNMSQAVTALEAGKLHTQHNRDILLIGSPTQLLAYDVQQNADIFFKQAPNGVSKILIGNFGKIAHPVAIVGGHGSIVALDHQGNELFWNVVGDDVKSLMLMDLDKDGANELFVGCSDYTIKVFKEDQILTDISETETIIGMSVMQENRFSYSLSNGTVGIYEEGLRLWRVKSKNIPVNVMSYDLVGSGSNQLITGWSNGKVDARDVKTGDVVYKDHMVHPVAGLVLGDYRECGHFDLICVSIEGEVRGYTTSVNAPGNVNIKHDQDTISELFTRKQALLLELKHYETNTKFNEQYEKNNREMNDSPPLTVGVIPANTRLQIGLSTNVVTKDKKACVQVAVSTNNFTIIKAVMIFAEGIFEGETLIEHPAQNDLSNSLDIALYPPKDVAVDIHIKAFVGYPDSRQFHVFELTRQLPRFSMYSMPDPDEEINKETHPIPSSYVTFHITERVQRICIWINQNFLLPDDIEVANDAHELHILLNCLRDRTVLLMDFEASGDVKLNTSNMALAGDLVQSLSSFLNLEHLQSRGHFPDEESRLRELVESLDGIQETRMRLDTDVAEQMQTIKYLVAMADGKRSYDLDDMMKCYQELIAINSDLIRGNNIRLTNHNESTNVLKEINSIIQKASRLRVGKYSSGMINDCKTTIKNKNVDSLIKIISVGEA